MDANYYLILLAVSVSAAGDWLYRLALPIAVLKLTHSADTTAIMYSLEFVPYILLGPIAGTVADRVNRRWLLITMQAFATVVAVVLSLLVAQHMIGFLGFFILGTILSCSQVFFQPALQGLIQSTIVSSRQVTINTRIQTLDGIFGAMGPVFGAGVVAILGVSGAIIVDACTFACGAAILALLKTRTRSLVQGTDTSVSSRKTMGIMGYLKQHKEVLFGIILFGGTNFGLLAIESNLIFIVVRYMHLSNFIAGVVLAVGGLGSLVGAMLTPRLNVIFPVGKLVVLCMFGAGLVAAAMITAWWLLLAVAWGVTSVLVSIIVVTWLTFQQNVVPPELLGRVTSVGRMISFAAIPVGAIVGGLLIGNLHSLLLLVTVGGGSQIVIAILGRVTPLWKAESTVQDLEIL